MIMPLSAERGARLMLAYLRMRTAAHPRETAVHAAADKHILPIARVVAAAFKKGRRAGIKGAPDAIQKALAATLPDVLLAALKDGGKAAYEMLPTRRAAGDVEGHEFHGNQYTSGSANPMAGEKKGEHTPAAQKRVIDYLQKETGEKFSAHGSVAKGETSKNDMDIVRRDPTQGMSTKEKLAYEQKQSDEANRQEQEIRDKMDRGEITQHEGMQQLYGEYKDPLHTALEKIGFKPTDSAHWLGIQTIRFENPKTKHTIEIWQKGDEHHYGLEELRTAKDKAPKVTFKMSFDASNPDAAKWAREHGAQLAKDISDTTRDRIREAIARQHETGEGSEDDILDEVGDAARATMIARTESMDAANEGLAQGWAQAVEDGLLTGNEQKEWIAAEDPCPECEEVDGETVPMDEDFSVGDDPPLHPNCRCTMGLVS